MDKNTYDHLVNIVNALGQIRGAIMDTVYDSNLYAFEMGQLAIIEHEIRELVCNDNVQD